MTDINTRANKFSFAELRHHQHVTVQQKCKNSLKMNILQKFFTSENVFTAIAYANLINFLGCG